MWRCLVTSGHATPQLPAYTKVRVAADQGFGLNLICYWQEMTIGIMPDEVEGVIAVESGS